MKAAVLHTIGGTFEIEDVAIDDPRGGEVLVDVKASSLCHSDITVAENDIGRPLPIILGHEVAGVVTAVGPEVRGLAVGDKVVGCLTSHCGTCQSCLLGTSGSVRISPLSRPGALTCRRG